MLIYFLSLALAFFVTYLTTPVVKRLAAKIGAVDVPNDRKIHSFPVPRLGGLSIYAGFMAAVGLAFLLAKLAGSRLNFAMGAGVVLGGSLLMLVGIFDDIHTLRPTTKLVWQTIASGIVIAFGVEISFISNPFNGILSLGILAVPLTLFWMVGVTNAINLIDGLDGLATGVTAIASLTLFFVALRTHQVGAAILMISLFGACLAFLRFNFFPATIFLGDSGSMLLGFILAASSVIGVLKTTLVVALIVPLLVLGVPIMDTLFAIGRRIKNGRHPFEADNKHIHHLLLNAGLNKREAVLAIYAACFMLSYIALAMALPK
ncbi:MAG: undecaprenyl/decaprenyl-phosphate alpha-N-acetylglucosaminyl 1-phosphate transferase [Candidatus Saganbacteria bacterium]|nr:undecaprenyl/decaprenyl-phosphate alpha-N-acetylglucosaminyl 1-phosphate transferase [Candidatus Saganbacteria bacterium]